MQTQSSYIQAKKDVFVEELLALLRIPSVSTDAKFKGDVLKAADFLAEKLKIAGADKVEICPTAGYPIVYGEKMLDPKAPTVLVYGHYDVQPADPYELWNSPPFEPVIKDGKIYARGACDDKGQMYMHVKAFETMMQTKTLTCNVKFMLEGEEEIGSVNLETFVAQNKERLKADVILISDTGMISNEIPSITVGLRGLSYMEVEVTGPNRDLHSGLYGGAVVNPINALCGIIHSLKDENGKITIPNFYDKVLDVPSEERKAMASAPFDAKKFLGGIGLIQETGEKGYSTMERISIRPTLDCNGIWGGYIQEGAKTVIPSKAYAKISMRLVPNQNSTEISDLFKKHIESIAPKFGVTAKVTAHHGGEPVLTPTDSIAYKAASNAYEATFGRKPVPMRGGGSIPIVAMFKKVLATDSVMMGFGLDSDAIHSPNEHYGLFNYMKGIETIPLFYQHYEKLMRK
jgi:acetylornithine deacetylase/succinyl-diaminopimelate desuccinylase-like protein